MSDRRYNDDEFALILKRASESMSVVGTETDTISRAELRHLAEEAHIDPARLEEALTKVQMERPGWWERLIRLPSKFFEERHFGWEVPPEGRARLVAALRRVEGRQGKVEAVLDGLEWQSGATGTAPVHARIHTREGETRVELFKDMSSTSGPLVGLGGPSFGVLAGIAAAGLLSTGPGLAAAALIAGGGVVGTGVTWRIYKGMARRTRERLDRTMDELSREIRTMAREASERPSSETGLPGASADSVPTTQGFE